MLGRASFSHGHRSGRERQSTAVNHLGEETSRQARVTAADADGPTNWSAGPVVVLLSFRSGVRLFSFLLNCFCLWSFGGLRLVFLAVFCYSLVFWFCVSFFLIQGGCPPGVFPV